MRERSVNVNQVRKDEEEYRKKSTKWYAKRHRVQERSDLQPLTQVRLQDPGQKPCSATLIATKGCEVILQKDNGNLLRRNRRMITTKAPEYVTPSLPRPPVPGVIAPTSVQGVIAPPKVSKVLHLSLSDLSL